MLGAAGCIAPEALAAAGIIPPETGVVWFRSGTGSGPHAAVLSVS